MTSHEVSIGRTLNLPNPIARSGSKSRRYPRALKSVRVQKTRNDSAQFSFCFTTRSAGGNSGNRTRKPFPFCASKIARANGGIAQLVER